MVSSYQFLSALITSFSFYCFTLSKNLKFAKFLVSFKVFELLTTSWNFKNLSILNFMNNLIDWIHLQPVPSTVVIILCVTVAIWQILKKMTAQNIDREHEAKIIRALVIARGNTGATLQQIKCMKSSMVICDVLLSFKQITGDYLEQMGKMLEHHGNSDYELRKWLESIAHIKTAVRDNQIVYFSEAPDQQHLTELIRKQKNNSRNVRRPRTSLRTSVVSDGLNATFATPKSWTNSLVIRRSKLANSSFGGLQNVNNVTFKRPFTPNRTFLHQAKPQAPKRSLPMDTSSIVGSAQKNFSCFPHSDDDDFDFDVNNNDSSSSHSNMSRMSNISCVTDRFIEESRVSFAV